MHFSDGDSARRYDLMPAALTPTLIFTLVLATILRERFGISATLYGALLIYAGLATMLPSLVMRKPVDFNMLPDEAPKPEAV